MIATGRPVPSGRHGVNPPAAGPGWQRLAEIGWPTPGPACHWLRRVGGGVPVRAQWALRKRVGARKHHTATPHLPSIRLHTPLPASPPLAFLERETTAAGPQRARERNQGQGAQHPVRPQQESERQKAVRRERRDGGRGGRHGEAGTGEEVSHVDGGPADLAGGGAAGVARRGHAAIQPPAASGERPPFGSPLGASGVPLSSVIVIC